METISKEDFYRGDKRFYVDALKWFKMYYNVGNEYKMTYDKRQLVDTCVYGEGYERVEYAKKKEVPLEEYHKIYDELFEEYVQPYIDYGFLEYKGKKLINPWRDHEEDYWYPTAKCEPAWKEIIYEKTEGKKRRAIEAAVQAAGVQATDGKGVEAKYMNPRCYTEDPGMPGESATELITFAILTIPCLMLYIGPALIAGMWITWIINFIKRREGIRQMWEMDFRRRNGLL